MPPVVRHTAIARTPSTPRRLSIQSDSHSVLGAHFGTYCNAHIDAEEYASSGVVVMASSFVATPQAHKGIAASEDATCAADAGTSASAALVQEFLHRGVQVDAELAAASQVCNDAESAVLLRPAERLASQRASTTR